MVQLVVLPEEQHFIFIDGDAANPRVMISVSDIKAIIFPQGPYDEESVVTIRTWDKTYAFKGNDAEEIEEFLTARAVLWDR